MSSRPSVGQRSDSSFDISLFRKVRDPVALADERRREDAAEAAAAAVPPQVTEKHSTWFMNLNGHKIHVRIETPVSAKKANATLLLVHRVGSHCDRSAAVSLARKLARAGIIVLLMDLQGHGYSEGPRCEMSDFEAAVTDVELLVDIFTMGHFRYLDAATFGTDVPLEMLDRIADLPFAVAGESTGAALVLLAGLRLRRRELPVVCFLGVVLLAPCLRPAPPPSLWEGLGDLLSGSAREKEARDARGTGAYNCRYNRPEMLWGTEELRRRDLEEDCMSWKGPLPPQTFEQVESMLRRVQKELGEVDFPFLVVGDPGDSVSPPAAAQELVQRARTPLGLDSRRVEALRGALQDPLANRLPECLDLIIEWVFNQKMEGSEKWKV